MIELLIKGALSYLLGSVIGGLVVGHLKGGIDIRSAGSGNAGGTNALRTQGAAFAFWVMVIDIGKGWLASAFVARWMPSESMGGASPLLHPWSLPVCGLAVMLGHIYPVWYGFRGGKGVATLLGVVLGTSAWLLVPMIAAWLLTAVLTGYVGLASIVASVALAIAIALSNLVPRVPLESFGILAVLVILYTHRGNIKRMRAGSEPRAKKLWLLGARRGSALR